MILFIVPLAAWLYNQGADIASGVVDFLRSIPSLIAPKPDPIGSPYDPPFLGGQIDTEWYVVFTYDHTQQTIYDDSISFNSAGRIESTNAILVNGIVQSITAVAGGVRIVTSRQTSLRMAGSSAFVPIIITARLYRVDNNPNTGGNLPNPTPAPSIPDDGIFKPNNPYITDSNDVVNPSAIVLAPGLPLVLVPLISSAIAAALAAARAAVDALEAIKKIAEALEGLGKLWDKLKEFLDEWEKNRPKKRDITRQTYGRIEGDGALDFFAPNSKTVQAIQLDVIVTNIPIGFGKYFGNMSPSRYRYKELGYIAFYSTNQGILETHSVQFKRTTLQIPPLAVGFIYHFGLDNQIKAFAFATFSIEK